MKKYIKNYLDWFCIGIEDTAECEWCGKGGQINNGFDIHHITHRSHVFGKDRDNILNLMLLCRDCHDKAHNEKIKTEDLLTAHHRFMDNYLLIHLI